MSIIIIIVAGFILDRISKIWAVTNLKNSSGINVVNNFFGFSYVENRGAAWSILQNKTIFLSIMTIIVIIAIICYILKYKPKSEFLKVCLSLIIGGGIGNLFDRIYYKYVIDFISLHFKDKYYFPYFNVSDICVTVGTFMLCIYLLRNDKNEKIKS